MLALELLAERKIAEAIARGELDHLPGCGRPLALDDDPLVPEDVRIAYRVLKNAGFVPPEVESIRAIAALEHLIAVSPDDRHRGRAVLKLQLLRAQLERTTSGRSSNPAQREYQSHLLSRLGNGL